LPPYYYRDNFMRLCDMVQERYADILAVDELDWLQTYRELPFPAQCLYVRLISRVGPWFRTDRLDYPEIASLQEAWDQLLRCDMAAQAEQLEVEEVGRLYTRDELRQVFDDFHMPAMPAGKADMLASIEALEFEPAALLDTLQTHFPGPVIGPCGVDRVQLLQLLFFGNRYQSLTEFVLSDLGISRFFPYALDPQTRLFAQRDALEEYLYCAALADRHREIPDLEETDALADLATVSLELSPCHPSSERRWYRHCNALARDLERVGLDDLAEQLYARSGAHPARERRARVLERRGSLAEAQALCEEILAAPWGEEEAEAAARILPRIRRVMGGDPVPRRREQFPRMDLVLDPADLRVEALAARRLSADWSSVHYVENSLMNALFGLAFWEEIFAPLPGVFHNPYQSAPSDMYEQGFRQRREALLERRLDSLAQLDLRDELAAAYRRYQGFQCRWVNWRRVDEALVQRAAGIIPAAHLLAIWERMLFDPRENRRGFPDLLALGECPGDYLMVEVKGPGDALQAGQKRWLRFFGERDIPASVAWVTWADA
jgi:hypothetical protein